MAYIESGGLERSHVMWDDTTILFVMIVSSITVWFSFMNFIGIIMLLIMLENHTSKEGANE